MAQNGTLTVRTFVSTAQLPVSDAAVIVSAPSSNGRQKLIAIQMTDRSGTAGPIALDAPNIDGSLTPGQSESAFSSYTLTVEHPDYQLAVFDNIQIFPDVETDQDVPLIPLAVGGRDRQDPTLVTPQPL